MTAPLLRLDFEMLNPNFPFLESNCGLENSAFRTSLPPDWFLALCVWDSTEESR